MVYGTIGANLNQLITRGPYIVLYPNLSNILGWLVVWKMNFVFSIKWECHDPN